MSNKKLFALISDQSIHTGSQKKVIPAETFSKLIDAEEILKAIKIDAENYRHSVVNEIEALKEQAQKDGYSDGFQSWAQYIEKLETEIQNVHKTLQKIVLPVAIKAAKKIVGKELEVNNQIVVDIVANSLKSVAQHKKITLWCSKTDYKTLNDARPQLKNLFEDLQSLSVRPREDLQQGSCIIETEGGIIDARIEQLWDRMEKAFSKILQSESTHQNANASDHNEDEHKH